jgi:hypothetical protein
LTGVPHPADASRMSAAEGDARETFNPWTVVNLVFHHLAENGLHPVLGETGDPAAPATALLRAMGIEPGRNDESVTSATVQDELAALRARYLGEA